MNNLNPNPDHQALLEELQSEQQTKEEKVLKRNFKQYYLCKVKKAFVSTNDSMLNREDGAYSLLLLARDMETKQIDVVADAGMVFRKETGRFLFENQLNEYSRFSKQKPCRGNLFSISEREAMEVVSLCKGVFSYQDNLRCKQRKHSCNLQAMFQPSGANLKLKEGYNFLSNQLDYNREVKNKAIQICSTLPIFEKNIGKDKLHYFLQEDNRSKISESVTDVFMDVLKPNMSITNKTRTDCCNTNFHIHGGVLKFTYNTNANILTRFIYNYINYKKKQCCFSAGFYRTIRLQQADQLVKLSDKLEEYHKEIIEQKNESLSKYNIDGKKKNMADYINDDHKICRQLDNIKNKLLEMVESELRPMEKDLETSGSKKLLFLLSQVKEKVCLLIEEITVVQNESLENSPSRRHATLS